MAKQNNRFIDWQDGPVRRLARGGLCVFLLLVLLLPEGERAYAQSCTPYPSPRERFGFNVARDGGRRIEQYDVAPLQAHWYLDYATQRTPAQPAGMTYAQMIRPPFWKSSTFTRTVETALQNNPGALWIVGNEPDRDKQDGQTPAEYAVFYHNVYNFLKMRDASAHVAIAGVVQSTPLRRRYLDMALAEYQNRYGIAMPIDVWTLHAFILPENYIWGASIPPGLEAYANEGMQYTVTDHDNMTIFKRNVIDFRQWMADRGYRDKPLLVTEYGILLSPAHGFPYAKVKSFMLASFDFFLTATDAATGYPADDNRLVQSWSWFSLNYPPYDQVTNPQGHNGNLMEPDTAALLPLGQDYGAYIAALPEPQTLVLTVPTLQVTPSLLVITDTVPVTTEGALSAQSVPLSTGRVITFTATLANAGSITACNLTLRLTHQDPQGNQSRLTTQRLAMIVPTAAADSSQTFTFTWQPSTLALGVHKLILTVEAAHSNTGLATTHLRQEYSLLVVAKPLDQHSYLPLVGR